MIIVIIIKNYIKLHHHHDHNPQEGCEHGREKAWTIDPEKVIGGGVGSSVGFIIIIILLVLALVLVLISMVMR